MKVNPEKFLYRRQFILSSKNIQCFETWKELKLTGGLTLIVHPDLEISDRQKNSSRIILLGFMLDPFFPEKTNNNILDDLLDEAEDFEKLPLLTDKYGGRWCIIHTRESVTHVFHDPFGMRQVFYHTDGRHIALGSSIAIIKHFFDLERTKNESLQKFLNAKSFLKKECLWLGDETIFQRVKHLMPNFFLKLPSLQKSRFWPSRPIKETDPKQAVERSIAILGGTLKAASLRRPLTMAVTSGIDSRVLLAASKQIAGSVNYFVSDFGNRKTISKLNPDVSIPQKIFNKINLPFYVQRKSVNPSGEFQILYKANLVMARTNLPKNTFTYQYFSDFENTLLIEGTGAEIVRIYPDQRLLKIGKINGKTLSSMFFGYHCLAYPKYQMEKWLSEINPFIQEFGLNVCDMAVWEQEMGNWGALHPAEKDISVDQFTPYNNRLYLQTMFGVDVKYRNFPDFKIFKEMINTAWPDLLVQPFNPKSLALFLKMQVRHLLVTLFKGYR